MAPHRIADSDKVRAMFSGPRDSIDFSTLRRALVVKLRHHGDVLLTSPVFTARWQPRAMRVIKEAKWPVERA